MLNLELPENLPQSLYPLAWFVGDFVGEGFVEENFGFKDSEHKTKMSWEVNEKKEQLIYNCEITVDNKVLYEEKGVFSISKARPPALSDPQLFPVKAKITTHFFEENNELKETWKTEYLGVVGKGRMELLSDTIDLIRPLLIFGDQKVNDLWRSKRMFGFVSNKIYWHWELAFLPIEGIHPFISGRVWKP